MINFNLYFYILAILVSVIFIIILHDKIKEFKLFIKESNYRRICKKCNVSQILDGEDGFYFWKKIAKSNCECNKYISYFIK